MTALNISKTEVQHIMYLSAQAFADGGQSQHIVAALIEAVDNLPTVKQRELIALMEFGNAITIGESPEAIEDLLRTESPIHRNPSGYLSTMTTLPVCLENALKVVHQTATLAD